jgi:hypothetical protein
LFADVSGDQTAFILGIKEWAKQDPSESNQTLPNISKFLRDDVVLHPRTQYSSTMKHYLKDTNANMFIITRSNLLLQPLYTPFASTS